MTIEAQNQQNPRYIDSHIEEVDVSVLLSSIYRRKILALFVFLVSILISIFLISNITPRYAASAIIQIEKNNFKQYRPKDIIKSLKSNVFNSSEFLTELQVLKSRKIALEVIRELDLVNDLELGFKPQGETSDNILKHEGFNYQVTNRTNKFLDQLKITPISGANLVKISFTSSDPQKAVRIVNKIIAVYTKLKLLEKNKEQEKITKWLESHVNRLRSQVSKSEEEIVNYKTANNLLEIDTHKISESKLEELNKKLSHEIEKHFEIQTTLKEIKKSGIIKEVLETNLGQADSNLIRNLKLEELDLETDISELSNIYGPKHPKIIEKKSEMRALKNVIKHENKGVIKSYNIELKIIEAKINNLKSQLQESVDYVNKNGNHLIVLDELERESNALKMSSKTFIESFESFLMRPELKEANIKIISDTTVPISSLYPNKTLFISLSVFLSLFLGLIVAIIADKLSRIKLSGDGV